jgi:uncharacterized protein involved in type VI secretion and phage assembly
LYGEQYEIAVGIVSDLDDPGGLGRVRVTFPHWDDTESNWARLATPMAGKDRGMFYRPEKEDEVLVAFEQGDPRRPYIIGGLWSKADTPPADDGKATENNWRFIRSRSGHLIKLDDTEGKERIDIFGKDEKHRIAIDVSGEKIQIECDSGDVEITASQGNVNVTAKAAKVEAQTVEVKGDTSVKVQAPQIEMKADSQMSLDGGGQMTLKAGMININ